MCHYSVDFILDLEDLLSCCEVHPALQFLFWNVHILKALQVR